MDAAGVHAAVSDALTGAGLDRKGRSRWYARSPELVWVAELDRATARPWSVMFGALVRAWTPDNQWPHYQDAHLFQEYANHGSGVPAAAVGSRFDDHRSYFTMVLDHAQALVSDDERHQAAGFLARDLATLFQRVGTLDALASAVRTGQIGGFVDRRLRRLAEGVDSD